MTTSRYVPLIERQAYQQLGWARCPEIKKDANGFYQQRMEWLRKSPPIEPKQQQFNTQEQTHENYLSRPATTAEIRS